MKKQLRKKRTRLKIERIEILKKVDRLQNNLLLEQDEIERGKLLIEIRSLGNLLEQKVVNPVSDHAYTKSDEFQVKAKLGTKRIGWSMDYKEYIQLKKSNLSDEKIAVLQGATISQLLHWKYKNKITKEHWEKGSDINDKRSLH